MFIYFQLLHEALYEVAKIAEWSVSKHVFMTLDIYDLANRFGEEYVYFSYFYLY
jgi:hypothetical protein